MVSCNTSIMCQRMSYDLSWASGSSVCLLCLCSCLTVQLWVIISQQKEVMEELSLGEEGNMKAEGNPSPQMRHGRRTGEKSKMWETVQSSVEQHHPNKAVAERETNLFKENSMLYFCEVLKRRRKQAPLDQFLVRAAHEEKDSTESEDSRDSMVTACYTATLCPSQQPWRSSKGGAG